MGERGCRWPARARPPIAKRLPALATVLAGCPITAFLAVTMKITPRFLAKYGPGRTSALVWATTLATTVLLGLAAPAAAQSQLALNPLPKGYHGPPPSATVAQPGAVVRVSVRVVDADGRPLPKSLVRIEGAPQQLWADDQGTVQLLVRLDRGPLHLTGTCYGYDDAQLSISRPEDNNLIFQLFRSKALAETSPKP